MSARSSSAPAGRQVEVVDVQAKDLVDVGRGLVGQMPPGLFAKAGTEAKDGPRRSKSRQFVS